MNSAFQFGGDKKVGESFLTSYEKRFVAWGVPYVPRWLETYHLTMATLLWSIFVVVSGYLASLNLLWLLMISFLIVLQYVTDLFDGAIGRARNTGLVKWGFFMDHFLDYIFLSSLVFAGYLISPPGLGYWHVLLLIIVSSFMVTSFLSFAATNRFEIYIFGIGPTEMRIVFILINLVILSTGTSHFWITLPLTCGITLIALGVVVWRVHQTLWQLDMQALQRPHAKEP